MSELFYSIYAVFSNLVYSVFIAAFAVTMYVMIKFLQRPVQKSDKNVWEKARELVVLGPIVWLFLQWGESPTVLANLFFGFWLPVVLVSIFALGLMELLLPVWYSAKDTGTHMRKSGEKFGK